MTTSPTNEPLSQIIVPSSAEMIEISNEAGRRRVRQIAMQTAVTRAETWSDRARANLGRVIDRIFGLDDRYTSHQPLSRTGCFLLALLVALVLALVASQGPAPLDVRSIESHQFSQRQEKQP